MSGGVDKLARALTGVVKRETAAIGLGAELGTVTAAGLQLDNFKHPIRRFFVVAGLPVTPGTQVAVIPLSEQNEFLAIPITTQEV